VSARLALFGVIIALGCSKGTETAPARAPQRAAVHRGPLTDFVPAAGLRWLIVGQPHEIARNPWLKEALGSLLPEARLTAYSRATGVDLRALPSGLIAGFDFGTLYMAELRSGEAEISRQFEERLIGGAAVRSPHPELRVVQGVVGQTPETLILVRGQLVAVAVGDPTPVRAVEGFATRRLKRSPPALHGSALKTLPAELNRAPIRFFAPGPFEGEWSRAGRGLLGSALALGIAARPGAQDQISVDLVLSGEFRDLGPQAKERLLGAFEDLAQSSLGHLLGLNEPLAPPIVSATDQQLRLQVQLPFKSMVRGLRAAVIADVWEILDIPKPVPPEGSHLPVQKR
jgi:hypothetical protein